MINDIISSIVILLTLFAFVFIFIYLSSDRLEKVDIDLNDYNCYMLCDHMVCENKMNSSEVYECSTGGWCYVRKESFFDYLFVWWRYNEY